MKRLLSPALPTPNHAVPLPEAEAHHALQVFRLGDGDEVEVMDGVGHSVIARLRVREKHVDLVYEKAAPVLSAPADSIPVILELAVLKGPSMEWAVEKSVELGVTRLQPLTTAHTIVQLDRKGPEAFQERWQKIADQALKQCGRLTRLEILAPIELVNLLAEAPATSARPRLWADESQRAQARPLNAVASQLRSTAREICLLIGPEGGWSAAEKTLLSRSPETVPVSLGPLTLRAETAAIAGVAVLASSLASTT